MALTQDQWDEYQRILRNNGEGMANEYLANANAQNAAEAGLPQEYNPDIGAAFGRSQDLLNQYNTGLRGLRTDIYDPTTGEKLDLSRGIQDVDAYKEQEYLYKPLDAYKGLMPYEQADYNFADIYAANAPEAYKAAQFDWTSQYQAPDEYQAFQYQAPEIADIQKVQPMADELWSGLAAGERERIGRQYQDTAERMKQAAIQSMARPEQMAALEANLGIEQAKAQTEAQRALDVQRAQQAVGIAQAEQGLQATRALSQAQLKAQEQENQAQELARKYGMDIDAARYTVQQYQTQQVAQAEELAKKYGLDIGAAKELAGQQAAQQTAKAGEQRYGQEWGRSERDTAMALEQAQKEAKAAEYEKAYQSKYGLAQDVAQTRMAQNQAENAARLDAANARLQGQQAAAQAAAQQATYRTNLTEGERSDLQERAKEQAIKAAPATAITAKMPTNKYSPKQAV